MCVCMYLFIPFQSHSDIWVSQFTRIKCAEMHFARQTHQNYKSYNTA
jgi:hypothetical protein